MMRKFPWMKFYTTHWLGDMNLRGVSVAARGLWIDLLCLMDVSPRRGFLVLPDGKPMTPEHVSRMTGIAVTHAVTLIAELRDMQVFSETPGGIIFSRRMKNDDTERKNQNNRQAKFRDKSLRINENSNATSNASSNTTCHANVTPNVRGDGEGEEEEEREEEEEPPFIPPQAGDDKKPKPKKSRKPKSEPTPEHIALIALWKSKRLDQSERAGQAYYAPASAAQIATGLAEHGITAMTATIENYAAAITRKPDWQKYAVQFGTFFGPQKQLWRDHLPAEFAGSQSPVEAGLTFKIPSQAIQPDDPANPKKYYSRILPQQPPQPKPQPEPTEDW